MSASELRASARKLLQGKWGKGALIVLTYLLITYAIIFVLGLIPFIGAIASIVILVPISYGILVSFLKLKRGEDVKYIGFLEESFNNFGKVWGVCGYTILKMIVPVILVIISVVLLIFSTGGAIISGFLFESSSMAAFLKTGIIALILYIVAIIYCMVKGLLYILTSYILYDNPDMTSKEIVEESEKLMKGNRGKYVWLEFTFIGWMILAGFTFGIGLLWLVPYVAVSVICFYEALSGKVSREEVIESVDDNPISE